MKEDSNCNTGWAQLDRDTLAAIVGLLEPREVIALACTCREARSAARDNAIWAPLLSRYFGLNTQVHTPPATFSKHVHLPNPFFLSSNLTSAPTLYDHLTRRPNPSQASDNVSLLSVFRILIRAFQTGTGNGNGGSITISSGSSRHSSWVGAVPLEGLYTDGGLDMSDASFWVRAISSDSTCSGLCNW